MGTKTALMIASASIILFLGAVHVLYTFWGPKLLPQLVGLLMLAGFFVLGWMYWFSVPFIGISIALVCYVASLFVARA